MDTKIHLRWKDESVFVHVKDAWILVRESMLLFNKRSVCLTRYVWICWIGSIFSSCPYVVVHSVVSDSATSWIAAHQASLSITTSWSLLKLTSIKSVMPSPSPPAFSLFQHQSLSSESVLHIKWPKYWSFNFSISPSNEYSGLISFKIDWFDLLTVQVVLWLNPSSLYSTFYWIH